MSRLPPPPAGGGGGGLAVCMLLLVLHVLSEFLTSLGAEATKRLPSMQLRVIKH
jgi:hypothetical protein